MGGCSFLMEIKLFCKIFVERSRSRQLYGFFIEKNIDYKEKEWKYV